MKNRKLSDKDLNKYSSISGVELNILAKLNNLGALDVTSVHTILIKNEYKKLFDSLQYTGKQIKEALAKEYGLSAYHIESLIYDKGKNKLSFCKECGAEMSGYKFTKNKGRCDNCIVEQINKSI